jgi:hypothetical protein
MSFYVNLPSNSSVNYYPNNTLQSFKTTIQLYKLLALDAFKYNKSKEIMNNLNINERINIAPLLYVYCDIIDYQLVGDVHAQLLRCCNTVSVSDSYVHLIYDSPHYIKVTNNYVSDINISIFLDNGDIVKFKSGKKLFVKLHFRPCF